MVIGFRKTATGPFEILKHKDLIVDKVNKTITCKTDHFSDWTIIKGVGYVSFNFNAIDYEDWEGSIKIADYVYDTVFVTANNGAGNYLHFDYYGVNAAAVGSTIRASNIAGNDTIGFVSTVNNTYIRRLHLQRGDTVTLTEIGPKGGLVSGNFSFSTIVGQTPNRMKGNFIFLRK
jgi:hypothetical protein